MLSANLTAMGRLAVFHPSAKRGNDTAELERVLRASGTNRDDSLGTETVPLRFLPRVLEALPQELSVRIGGSIVHALREEAQRLRDEATFLERVTGDAELYPFQQEGVAFLWRNRQAMLLDEMGLGKTPQSLMAIEPDAPALVLCPASLKTNWHDEARRWRRDLEPCVIKNRAGFRFPEPGEVVITNYAALPEDFDAHGGAWPGTHLILDEAHAMKNARAQRTQRGRALARRIHKRHGYVWLLSGTPILNRPPELWAMLVLLGIHKTCYRTFTNFAKLFGGKKDIFGFVWSGEVHLNAMEPLRQYALRRERMDVLPDLPSKTWRALRVSAPTGEVKRYLDALDMEELLFALDQPDTNMTGHLATMRKGLALHKYEKTLPLIKEYEEQGTPLVVFSAHRGPVEELEQREGWTTLIGGMPAEEKGRRVRDFQAGKYRGIGLTIQAGGTGHTLTHAHHAIFLDRMWTPAYNVQAEDRVCRIGQDRGVVITNIVADHEVDELVHSTLTEKEALVRRSVERLTEKPRPSESRELLAREVDSLLCAMTVNS